MNEHEAVNKRCSKVRLFILSNMAKHRFRNFVSYSISNLKGIVESLIIPHLRRNIELYASVTWTHRWFLCRVLQGLRWALFSIVIFVLFICCLIFNFGKHLLLFISFFHKLTWIFGKNSVEGKSWVYKPASFSVIDCRYCFER